MTLDVQHDRLVRLENAARALGSKKLSKTLHSIAFEIKDATDLLRAEKTPKRKTRTPESASKS